MKPEERARQTIDKLLEQAGWRVCNLADANIHGVLGVAIREFPLNPGHGFADYLLYVNGKACGVIEAKKEGITLKGVEAQSERYAQGLPAALPAWRRPLPFLFESTGVETQFTNGLDPLPRSRRVFAFFRPELFAQWLQMLPPAAGPQAANEATSTFLARMREMPRLVTQWGQGGANYQLWPAQILAVHNLEQSLAANKPKALIQMATGSGKTFTAISFIYRLIKFGGARRVLFLVDRGNLGRQTKKEFDQYASPYNSYKFGEEFIVQHLQGNQVDTNLLQRDFTASAPNQVVGWSMQPHMQSSLVTDALRMAWFRRAPDAGVIFHSDRGSQYCGHEFQAALADYKMKSSMSGKGDCWGNAPTESFWGRLKVGRLYGRKFETRRQAMDEGIDWMTFYNHRRIHSTLGYVSPMQFEKSWHAAQLLKAA